MVDDGEQAETGSEVSGNAEDTSKDARGRKRIPLRKNVLAIMLIAYLSILLVFVIMVWCGVDAKEAYDKISVPFVALIGGTLAITKDLI